MVARRYLSAFYYLFRQKKTYDDYIHIDDDHDYVDENQLMHKHDTRHK